MITPVVIVGLQWGDEGKGKIVDNLAQKADYVVRFNGGNNAGHTVVFNGQTFKFHHLPSGAIQGKKLLIAQGTVIYPPVLLEEIKSLQKMGIKLNLLIDHRTHIVMPYHRLLDSATENWKGKKATGSLKLGIGYCYEDKNNRVGIRLEDLITPQILKEKVAAIFPIKKAIIEKIYGQKVTIKQTEIIQEYLEYGKKLSSYITDVSEIVCSNFNKETFLFEGAHGTFLDPVFGTYPYTVAPYCIAGSVYTGVGFGPLDLKVIGVAKAYTTRVGNGPFPTEQKNKIGERLQNMGAEVGTTSGRTRRCGWLDLAMLRTAIRVNNCREIALTKLDVLSNFPKLKIATHYISNGKKLDFFPSRESVLNDCKPKYIELQGWKTSINHIRKLSDLPLDCRNYLRFIEKNLKIKIRYISTGADRNAVIYH